MFPPWPLNDPVAIVCIVLLLAGLSSVFGRKKEPTNGD